MIVTAGKNALLNEILNWIKTTYTKFKVGTDGTAVDASDTDLHSPIFEDGIDSIMISGNKVVFSFIVGASECNGYTLQEVGIFDVNGNMLLRRTFGSIDKTPDITIYFEVDVTITIS